MSSLSKQIQDLEERLACRQVQSRDELSGLLAEGFREHGASGRAYSRAEVLESYELGRPIEVELFDFSVTSLGLDAALATYRSREADERRARRVSVWVKEDGHWRILFHQGTVSLDVESVDDP